MRRGSLRDVRPSVIEIEPDAACSTAVVGSARDPLQRETHKRGTSVDTNDARLVWVVVKPPAILSLALREKNPCAIVRSRSCVVTAQAHVYEVYNA